MRVTRDSEVDRMIRSKYFEKSSEQAYFMVGFIVLGKPPSLQGTVR
jgi:hypothetical protein